MKEVKLVLKKQPKVATDAEVVSPDHFAGKSPKEIGQLKVYHGRKELPLSEFFEIEGEAGSSPGETSILVRGDLKKFKRIGMRMSAGKVVIEGDVGLHLGAQMSGGEIILRGNAGQWLGAEMSGGIIRVEGDVGPLAAANYPGSVEGMRGGIIHVKGNVGERLGRKMQRGTVIVEGDVGSFAGAMMRGGTIILLGKAGEALGYNMRRGTIISLSGELDLLPTFVYDCTYQPTFIKFYYVNLKKYGIELPKEFYDGVYDRYSGDLGELGKGEILILKKQ